jgi:hypothetical protein
MLRDARTAAQRFAIRKLIRAKSDREIARLLRRSDHLLNRIAAVQTFHTESDGPITNFVCLAASMMRN